MRTSALVLLTAVACGSPSRPAPVTAPPPVASLATPAVIAPAPPLADDRTPLDPQIKRVVLPNGLTYYLMKHK